jgi:hypothetical protein
MKSLGSKWLKHFNGWCLGECWITVTGNYADGNSLPAFSETVLTLLEETRKHSGIIFGCFQSDNFHPTVTHETEITHSAWLPEKEYQATKMHKLTTGHGPSGQQLSFQSMEN